MISTYSLKKDGEKSLSTNFKVKEFRCKDGSDTIMIDSALVDILQTIRNHFKTSVTINSAYRTETYNKKVGGAKSSYHLKGMAADICVSGVNPQVVAAYALSMSVPGIILYVTKGFVHIDTRPTPYHAKVTNSVTEKVESFGLVVGYDACTEMLLHDGVIESPQYWSGIFSNDTFNINVTYLKKLLLNYHNKL